MDLSNTKVMDGEYEILFSGTYNIYNNSLTLKNIEGFDFEFIFTVDTSKEDTGIKIVPDNNRKAVKVELINFNNPFGAGTVKAIHILDKSGGGKVYFSIYSKSLSDKTDFLQVTVTFYGN